MGTEEGGGRSGRFPGSRIARMDRDTTAASTEIPLGCCRGCANKTIGCEWGTRMVPRGQGFSRSIHPGWDHLRRTVPQLPDFRAGERNLSSCWRRLAGRAGRGERPGQVILQPYNPSTSAFGRLATRILRPFYDQEIGFPQGRWAIRRFTRLIQAAHLGRRSRITREAGPKSASGRNGRRLAAGDRVLPNRFQFWGRSKAALARNRRSFSLADLINRCRRQFCMRFADRLLGRSCARLHGRQVRTVIERRSAVSLCKKFSVGCVSATFLTIPGARPKIYMTVEKKFRNSSLVSN